MYIMSKTPLQSPKRSFSDIIVRFFEPVNWYRKEYFQAAAVASTYFMFDIYTILVLQHIATSFQNGDVSWIPRVLTIYAVAHICMFTRKRIVRDYGRVTLKRFTFRNNLTNHLKKYIHLDPTATEKVWTWRLLWIIKTWVLHQMDALTETNFIMTELVFKLAFAIYLVRQTNPRFVVWFILLQVLVYAAVAYADRFANYRRRVRKDNELMLNRVFVRILQNKQEVLWSWKTDYEVGKVAGLIDENQNINKNVNTYVRWMFNIPLMLVALLTIAIMVYTYQSIQSWTFDFWLFTWLSALLWYLQQLMLKSTKTFQNITKNFTHIEKMRDFFDATPMMRWYTTGKSFVHSSWHIDLKNISFSYDTWNNVFENLSLQILWGKKTAFVGVSWSGKSTLAKMIAWYIVPDKGHIQVDKQDLSTLSMRSYAHHVWYLTQEPSVFDGTILENIVYADDVASSSRIQKAIRAAHCEFIYDLPDWIHTEIGERGIRLSWGQRQRLAIAKVFLKNPKILILDEPTSALDSFSEEAISKAMHNLFAWRTVIIIAHRLQTVKEADDIILREHGQVKERGTHAELIALWGQYAKMLELQSGF